MVKLDLTLTLCARHKTTTPALCLQCGMLPAEITSPDRRVGRPQEPVCRLITPVLPTNLPHYAGYPDYGCYNPRNINKSIKAHYKCTRLLGCYAVSNGKQLPALWKSAVSPSSGQDNSYQEQCSSKMAVS